MLLGRSSSQPGAFQIWLPGQLKVISTSEVYMQETYMPWRKPGDRHIGEPLPVQADADAGQPPTLPEVDPSTLPELSDRHGSLAAEFERVTRLNNPEHSPPNAQSPRLSQRVLVLFSGPYSRPDGLISFLRKEGLHVSAIDNSASNGGDTNHDILKNSVYESLLRRVQRGEFLGVFAAPPCSTF